MNDPSPPRSARHPLPQGERADFNVTSPLEGEVDAKHRVRGKLVIREAEPGDIATVLRLIRELAVYEKLEHEVVATEALIGQALFGPKPTAHALLCDVDGKAVGFAVWFYNFSTFVGRPGIYLEDLFVEPDHRKLGIATAVFRHLAKRAVAENCGRFEWAVLNWNEPAIKFYERMGSVPMSEWHVRRLSGDNLKKLAA